MKNPGKFFHTILNGYNMKRKSLGPALDAQQGFACTGLKKKIDDIFLRRVMDFDWWRRDGFDWLNTGRNYLGKFFLAEVLMFLRGIPNKWSQHRPEFRFSGCSLDMSREL